MYICRRKYSEYETALILNVGTDHCIQRWNGFDFTADHDWDQPLRFFDVQYFVSKISADTLDKACAVTFIN